MTKEKRETYLLYLSRAWRERVKNIRSRAKESQKTQFNFTGETSILKNAAETSLDSELFARSADEDISVKQVFAGDKDFYDSFEDVQAAAIPQSLGSRQTTKASPGYKRFSIAQKVLFAGIIIVAAMLLWGLLKSPSVPFVGGPPAKAVRQTPLPKHKSKENIQKIAQQNPKMEPALDAERSVSLNVAQKFYLQADYKKAYATYKQLYQKLSENVEEGLVRDFLRLQMALCLKKTADYDQAGRLLTKASKSSSPAVCVTANYHLGLLENQRKQYLTARTRAYQAISLINAVDFNKDLAWMLQQNCYFLAAETVTEEVLSLCDVNQIMPPDLWAYSDMHEDPFASLNETQLRSFLNSGTEQLNKALLGPEIQEDNSGSIRRWLVVCHSAPIDEVLAKIASRSGLNVHWALNSKQTGIRERAVSLYLPAEMEQQVLTVASGCAGLLTSLNEKGIVTIYNPAEYSYLSEQVSLLNAEAGSLWQKFLITFHEDKRIANVHFILGLLHAQKGRVAESIAEYKLVANRFSRTSLAPFALLNSSKQKNNLHDYSGAHEDLKQLIEQYPDTEIIGQAYLCLADIVAKRGFEAEAAKSYCKVYDLNLSPESQTAAALAAGKSFYKTKDYESAAKWLTQYVNLVKDHKNKDLYYAYFLLGKAQIELGKPEIACDAFRCALSGQLPKEEYVKTVQALVEEYMRQQHFVEAFDVLEDAYSRRFSTTESVQILLLKSKVLRAMGLIDKAIVMLGDKAEYVDNIQLKTEIRFEQSECYIEEGDLNLAYKKLSEILAQAEPGLLEHKIAYRLADVCFKLERYSQTISVCLQLLDLQPPEQIKQKTLKLLAMAYSRQKNYDHAALALLGQWK